MTRRPCAFRERDVTPAIRAVEAAGEKARKALLSSPALLDQGDEVHMCGELGVGALTWADGSATSFWDGTVRPAGTYSMRHLWIEPIRPLLDLIREDAEASAA